MLSYAKDHTFCRACGEPLPPPYLDLGSQPLANALLTSPTNGEELTFPLAVTLCHECALSQLTVVVEPAVLYKDYAFLSGTTPAWTDHAHALVAQCGPPGTVLDIAANDGTQLKAFHAAGWGCIGVEPAMMPSVVDVPMYREFFTQELATRIRTEHRMPHRIIAQNVLGHVDDVVGFLTACRSILHRHGKVVIEVPHIQNLVAATAFDTIYHEHLSYWSTPALTRCAARAGLVVETVEVLAVHGGSRRYWLRHVQDADAEGMSDGPIFDPAVDTAPYQRFATAVQTRIADTTAVLAEIRASGKRLWAFGASAKGTVLLNALKAHGNTVWPEVILDDTRTKQGRWSPGVHLPIKPVTMLRMVTMPDVILILSWNWKDAIVQRCRDMGYAGEFLVAMPSVERFGTV